MFTKKGALASQHIIELIHNGFLKISETCVKPSSMDLPLGEEIYCVPGIFQVAPNKTVWEIMQEMNAKKIDPTSVLEPTKTYVVPVDMNIDLPENMYGYANPKSTSGRLDLHTRLLADGVPWYDAIPKKFDGKLWTLIQPKTFSVILNGPTAINQLRLFNGDTRLEKEELECVMQSLGLLFLPVVKDLKKKIRYKDLIVRDDDHSLLLSLDLDSKIIGYRAKKNTTPVEYNCIKKYKSEDYFDILEYKKGEYLYLSQNNFYILSTQEHVAIPPDFACEMAPMDDRLGDFRTHYAGFIDPGWGWGQNGEAGGRQLTLEVRVFEDMCVRHGQPIARIKIERLIEAPPQKYDQIDSNYSQQVGPTLSKQFI